MWLKDDVEMVKGERMRKRLRLALGLIRHRSVSALTSGTGRLKRMYGGKVRMAVGVQTAVLLLLAGAVRPGPRVDYQGPVCAVQGSTLTILCSFAPPSVGRDGKQVPVEIIRVVWCQNHRICQGSTPSVYDSDKTLSGSRYRYLGDTTGNCSLQITGVQEGDDATFRFRMEAKETANHFTGTEGVRVTVSDAAQMEVRSSRNGGFKRGEAVTLNCTTKCTFHQLEVTWLRDGHALKHTGPSLHLTALTAGDSGNYSCQLQNRVGSSAAFSLHVEAEEGGGVQVSLIVGVMSAVLVLLCFIILVLVIIRRRNLSAVRGEAALQYIQEEGAQQQEEDVSYAHIQFKARRGQARPVEVEDSSVIYSSVVAPG